jgi:2-keto-4-pentenoate hydratase/2-oxohepta-3-ene-1,7-dioic acid hydratase in catechol pathway
MPSLARHGARLPLSLLGRVADCIARVSQCETLYPGEVLCSGTVGRGSGMELGRRLSPGDVVELEVEGSGVLRNRIVEPH